MCIVIGLITYYKLFLRFFSWYPIDFTPSPIYNNPNAYF